jgi:hypothetical protein
MALIKLEVFAPNSERAAKEDEPDPAVAAAQKEAYERGYMEGSAATAERIEAEQAQLRSQLVEAIRDMEMSYSEARFAVLDSIKPVLDSLIEILAPMLAREGLGPAVVDLATRYIASAPSSELRIAVAAENVEAIEEATRGISTNPIVVVDHTLSPFTARLFWAEGFDQINLDECIAEIRSAMDSFYSEIEGDQDVRDRRAG